MGLYASAGAWLEPGWSRELTPIGAKSGSLGRGGQPLAMPWPSAARNGHVVVLGKAITHFGLYRSKKPFSDAAAALPRGLRPQRRGRAACGP